MPKDPEKKKKDKSAKPAKADKPSTPKQFDVNLVWRKDTKTQDVFDAEIEEGTESVLTSVYVKKGTFGKKTPSRIAITLRAADDE